MSAAIQFGLWPAECEAEMGRFGVQLMRLGRRRARISGPYWAGRNKPEYQQCLDEIEAVEAARREYMNAHGLTWDC